MRTRPYLASITRRPDGTAIGADYVPWDHRQRAAQHAAATRNRAW